MKGTTPKPPKVPQILIDLIGDHFLEAARYLREIQDNHPDEFVSVAKKLKIGHRKAYNLAQIDRNFHGAGVPVERLRGIGWTKLAILAPYVDFDNIDELLALAENSTAHELKMHLRGNEVDPEGRTVVLHFDRQQYAIFEQALESAGAVRHPRGMKNREKALIRVLSSSVSG